jgi:hypothetical protein
MLKRRPSDWLPALIGALISALCIQVASGSTRASEQLTQLRSRLATARQAQDWPAYIDNAEQQVRFLNGSPTARLELARAQAHAKDERSALEELTAYVRMGQASNLIETAPEYTGLRSASRYAALRARMQTNRSLITRSSVQLRLADARLLPEDIDYDARRKRFMLSSVLQHKVVAIDVAGNLTDFAGAPDAWPMMAIKIDQQRQLLWATEVAIKGFDSVEKSAQGRSALLCYDLRTARLIRRLEGPNPSALGDIALTREGDVIASDGDHGGVYRLKLGAEHWERLDRGEFISPQTAAMATDGAHIYIPDYTRGIAILDLRSKQVRWMAMDGKFALNGIDGLYRVADTLVAVQNGTNPERIVQFSTDSSGSRITAEVVIERSTETLGDPTHAVMLEHTLYYIANSGWDVLDERGRVEPGKSMTAPLIMRADMPLK